MQFWLMKSEPADVSIDDALAAPDATVAWTGVRNYQARNFMRDAMRIGDGVLFYHSSCAEPGIAGLAEVCSTAYPDPTQFDPESEYFDPKATVSAPRWMLVDFEFVAPDGEQQRPVCMCGGRTEGRAACALERAHSFGAGGGR